MNQSKHIFSLIPLLHEGSGSVFFSLSSIAGAGNRLEPIDYAFRPDFQADALAVGYKSNLLTNGGTLLGRYLLLVQRDEYPALVDRAAPVTNAIIDECWQQAFAFHAAVGGESGSIFFAEQIDKNHQLRASAPLFLCRKQQRSFHPPCPQCGGPLQLCRDDRSLADSGLPHYSRSLNRYLHCPDCRSSTGTLWYAKRRHGEDQKIVRDAADLIRDFGVLREDVEPSLQMPCPGCPHHQECYGASAQAVHRIQIISFYPFYLLMTRDYDFHGRDFSARLAGASARQLAAEKNARGEVANGQASRVLEGETVDDFLYPADDQRRFLELLYLKVRLLDTVAQDIVNGRLSGTFPGYFLTPADIGISFVSGSTLPNYWAFRLTYPGVERYLVDRFRLPGNMEAGQLCRYGFFWFFLLVSNSRQQETMLFDKLSRLLEEEVALAPRLSVIDDAFHPRQAWWEAPPTFETPWLDQWDMVLSTGLELLIRGYRQPDATVDQACAAAGTCLVNLRDLVLSSPTRRERPESRNVNVDHDIYKIITAIKTSWQQPGDRLQEGTDWSAREERAEVPDHTLATGPAEDRSSDQEKTVLTTPNNLSRGPEVDGSAPVQRRTGAPVTTETAEDFGISDVGTVADVPVPAQRLTPERGRNQLEETQVIGRNGITRRDEERAPQPEQRRASLSDQARNSAGDLGVAQQSVADCPEQLGDRSLTGGGPTADEDELEETVQLTQNPFVQGPVDRSVEQKREPPAGGLSEPMKTGHHAGEDDFLTETVVLKPKNKG